MSKTEIENKIASLNKGINSSATPDAMKKRMQEQVVKLQNDLKDLDNKTPDPKPVPVVVVEKPKVEPKKTPEPKKMPVLKKAVPKKAVAPDKKSTPSDRKDSSEKINLHPDCNELLEDYVNRKKSQEKSKKKHKKDSISDLIGWRLAGVATKTIKNISEADLKKSPAKYIKQFKAIQKETKIFIGKLKPLLGSDFNQKSLSLPLDKVINKFINQVKKK